MRRTACGIVALALGVTLVLASGACESDEAIQKDVAREAATSAPISVTAGALYAAYEANAIAAEQKYEGKAVLITGTVSNVDRDILGDSYVTLTAGGEWDVWGVQCFVAESSLPQIAGLTKGERITMLGKVEGYLLNVLVRGCTVR